ncbi:MAG TPA: cadherin-like beta sandwich domain-containing protein, partial [Candidatus Saccharimonadales bacterium]|nr:cadherin-like beta sandwich domain-containing protein [Candidatus Saccharimonadales bacterium]
RVAAQAYSNTHITLASGFNNVGGLCRDAAGNIYVADIDNFAVKKIPVGGGPVTTIGSGFGLAVAVAANAAGDVFVLDKGNNSIVKIPAGGSNVTIATGLNNPDGIAIDATGNLYVTNYGSNIVDKIPAGTGTLVPIGSGFSGPSGIAVDTYGNVYVGDTGGGNYTVKEIPISGGSPMIIAGGFFDPVGLATDAAGNVYVADELNSQVKRIPAGGGAAVVISSGILYPSGIAIDATGNLYVSDGGTNAVEKIVPVGGYFISPALPAGLIFNSATGAISGTAAATSPAANYTIKAYNSGGVGTATVNIKVAASTNATLASLATSQGTLSPVFAPATVNYTASVANAVGSTTVTPATSDIGATVKVNGVTVASGSASGNILLAYGSNLITTVVTAEDGVTKQTYTINLTRTPLTIATLSGLTLSSASIAPAFATATTSYTAAVDNTVTTITLTPTVSDASETVTVNGVAVSSGTASAAIPLAVGANAITTVATAQDGVTKDTYTVTVTRAPSSNSTLSSLKLSDGVLTPTFVSTTTTYTAAVLNSVTSITLTPKTGVPTSTITVNGVTVASGSASQSITLNLGANVINTVVTAQNGTNKKTYKVTVTRSTTANSVYDPVSVANPVERPQMIGDEITVHPGVSPNGDGINDFLIIENIANYPDNKLQIINRGGQLIFETRNYDNSTKVFDGHSNKTGAMQLPGTYFYSLDYVVNGVAKHKTGFVVLK